MELLRPLFNDPAVSRKRSPARGFTIVEMVIVIVVMGVVFGLGAMVLGRAFESYDLAQKTTDVDWQGRVAMERLARELRQIRSATAANLSVASGQRVWFVDMDGNNVCYYLAGTQLMRSDATTAANCSVTSPGAAQALADHVTALNFYYYTSGGAVTADPTTVYYVTVSVTVSESASAAGNIVQTYRVTVQPRSF